MIRPVSVLLILLMLIVPAASFAQDSPPSDEATTDTEQIDESARLEGRDYAQKHYQGWRWFGAGLVGGVGLGLIGAGIAIGFSQTGTAHPPLSEQQRLANMPKPYEDGFRLGYHQRARSKALIKTILGGVIGTGIAVAIVAAAEE